MYIYFHCKIAHFYRELTQGKFKLMPFPAMLRNEVGWFDEEENSADALSMRLANDATFVRAAFSNRLSIFIQDFAAVAMALLIGMLLQWRVALIALATVPVLIVSAVAQVCYAVLLLGVHSFNCSSK